MPGDLAGAAVLALAVGRWSIEAFDAAGTSLGHAEAAGPPATGQPFRASQLVLRTDKIRRLDLNCDYRTALLALGVQGAPSASESAARRTALEQALERFKGEEPVFEPNRRYRLMATTQVVEVAGRSLEGAEVEAPVGVTTTIAGPTCTVVQAFEFRTESPPGFATLSPLGVDADADPGLDTLEPYVREIVPPRGAPAFYRNYDLGVAFTADYVDQMYRSDGRTLGVRLRSDRGEELAVANTMGKGNEVVLRREERTWLSTLERASCKLSVSESALVRESVVRCRVNGPPLEPRRRYDGVLAAEKPPGSLEPICPLYAWSFVSSAFLNFADHLRLRGPVRGATIGSDPGQWLATAASAVAAGGAVESTAFAAMFGDVALERSLPEVIELHALAAGGATWAMLLSSPQPFDWGRITLMLTRLEIDLSGPRPRSIQVPVPIHALCDADGTRAFLLALDHGSAVAFENGDYILVATYRRNLGSGQPVLSERGNTADERVTIGVSLPVS